MFSYAPSAYLPSYTYAVAPVITDPHDRYLAALAEVKAAEANYLAAEAIQREEEALTRRLEEIRLRRQEETLRAPYSNQLYPQLSELKAYQAVYGPNYLGAFERDHVHTAALAQRHSLKAGLDCCRFDDCASRCGFRNVNANTANPRRSPFDPLDNRIVVRSQPHTPRPTCRADNRALLKLLFGAHPKAVTSTVARQCPTGTHLHTGKGMQPTRAQSLEEYFKSIGVLPVEQTRHRSSLASSETFSEDHFSEEFADLLRTSGKPDEKIEAEEESLSFEDASAAKFLKKFVDIFRTPTTSKNTTTSKPDASSASPAISSKAEDPTTATSADIRSSLAKIRSIETAFNTLKDNFLFPTDLDFISPASSPSLSPSHLATSDSEKPTTTERLSYSPRNRVVHSYEHELTVLLTQLDSVESLGHEGICASRKEVVGRVEKALEDLEKALEGRWRISVPGSNKADDVSIIPEMHLDASNQNANASLQPTEKTDTLAPSKEVKFDKAVDVISGPVPAVATADHDTAALARTSKYVSPSVDSESLTHQSSVATESPSHEDQDNEARSSEYLVTAIDEVDANAVEPSVNTDSAPEHSEDALESLAPVPSILPDIEDSARAVVVEELSVQSVPPILPGTTESESNLPSTDISSVFDSAELSTDEPDVDTSSSCTLLATPSINASSIGDDSVDDTFLLTTAEDTVVKKPNVKDDDDEWLEVDA